MLVLIRAITYASIFMAVFLVFLPARILSSAGIDQPEVNGPAQVVGLIAGIAGLLLAWWCVLIFVVAGRGTPAVFDAPRQLVVRGPYRWVRNPMYIGAGLVLAGVALYYESLGLAIYAAGFLLLGSLVVIFYEEPTLRRTFGEEYEAYCARTPRWFPRARAPRA
jgi:protein-S-isoprenylcysteine O-methyltransferase Ste14